MAVDLAIREQGQDGPGPAPISKNTQSTTLPSLAPMG
jgi:hypothetical protein